MLLFSILFGLNVLNKRDSQDNKDVNYNQQQDKNNGAFFKRHLRHHQNSTVEVCVAGSCEEGECCSIYGYCGTGPDYCSIQTCAHQCPALEDITCSNAISTSEVAVESPIVENPIVSPIPDESQIKDAISTSEVSVESPIVSPIPDESQIKDAISTSEVAVENPIVSPIPDESQIIDPLPTENTGNGKNNDNINNNEIADNVVADSTSTSCGSSGSSGFSCGGNSGTASFYDVTSASENDGFTDQVACGGSIPSNGLFVAVPSSCYSSNVCGKVITVSYKGKSISLPILDECASCGGNQLDLTNTAYDQLESDRSVGILQGVTWN